MRDRARDYALLLAVSAAVTLPNLGGTGLWDEDEGVNAQAAREMRDSGTWVIPTFNYQLRTAKPAMLYWFQRAGYAAFGVNEWSARLPSAVAGWLAVLLTYELARRMFGRATGILAGVVLASAVQFAMLARAATPDAVLLACTCLAYLAFWGGHAGGGNRWWVPTAAACGLAVLAKGPAGVALPGLVITSYFAWNRELGRLLDRRLAWALLAFVLVAGPWYGLVASETRGEWVKAFLGRENVGRFLSPLDGHRGPVWYYPAALFVMFAPWSAFLIVVAWYGVKGARRDPGPDGPGLSEPVRAYRFLVCWAAAYLVFFSAAATKLPNYIFPAYPALAVLTARFLVAWREGSLAIPRWVMPAAAGGTVFVGVVFAAAMAVTDRAFPGLGAWGVLGLVPVAGGLAMGLALRQPDRGRLVTAAAAAAVGFVSLIAAFPPATIDRYKAPKELVRASGIGDPTRDLRVGSTGWFRPSVVFYSGREVKPLPTPEDAAEFLAIPTPAYLFVPERVWEQEVAGLVAVPHRVAARHYDFLTKSDVLVITNEVGDVAARR